MSIYRPQSADPAGPVRGYAHRLVGWVKKRATRYGVAAALLLAAILLLAVAAGIGTAALFFFIELRYGRWLAYGVIGGFFAALGVIALLVALIMLKRSGPSVPKPPSAGRLLRQATPFMATRMAATPHSGASWRADATTRILATGAALLLIGWAASSYRQRSSPSEEPWA
jgi:hypothetical protein